MQGAYKSIILMLLCNSSLRSVAYSYDLGALQIVFAFKVPHLDLMNIMTRQEQLPLFFLKKRSRDYHVNVQRKKNSHKFEGTYKILCRVTSFIQECCNGWTCNAFNDRGGHGRRLCPRQRQEQQCGLWSDCGHVLQEESDLCEAQYSTDK